MNTSGLSSTSMFFRDESQNIEEYIAMIDTSNPAVTLDPASNDYDVVSLRNTGEYPVLVTITILDGKGTNQTPVDRKFLLDAKEIRLVDYSAEVVDKLKLEELDTSTVIAVDGIVDVNLLTGLTTPTSTIIVRATFLDS